MKSSAIRPTRGRSSKVTKTVPSPARGARPLQPRHQQPGLGPHTHSHSAAQHQHLHEAIAAAAAAAASANHQQQQQQQHQQQHDIKADHSLDPNAHSAHSNVFDDDSRIGAEDYAAAAAAAAAMETGLTADAHGEPEADADMEDDDPSANTSGLPHVDLTTAANILANGGQGNNAPQPPQDHQQQVDMQQALAQAHQHQQPQAQMGNPQHMQQPQNTMDPSLIKTTEELAHESGYTELNVESALAKRLGREPGHRHAHQRRPEQVLNLARRSNVEALFAHIAGETARVPCKNCHKGHGPWTSCVIVDGQMCGSCANCWFNASGARCSFHETRNPQVVSQHPNMMPTTTTGLPPDAAYRTFAAPHGLIPGAPNPGMAAMTHPALLTSNPVLQHMVNKAMTEVRQADKATRQLILIDITAKQLALQIAEYEELTHNQESTGGQGPGQQIMGDDGGA